MKKSPFSVAKAKRIFMRLGYSEQQFDAVMLEVRKSGHAKDLVHRPTFRACMFLALEIPTKVFTLFAKFYDADHHRLPRNPVHFNALYDAEQSVYTDDVSKAIKQVAHITGTKYLGTAVGRLERMKRFNNG